MRIAILTNAYPPEARGGAGRIAFLQAEGLRALGHEVRVWCVPLAWTDRSGLVRFACHVRDLYRVHPVTTEMIAWHPDWILSHNLTGMGFRTPGVIQSRGVSWAHILHDVQLFEPSGHCSSWEGISAWQRVWSSLRRTVLGKPDLIISPTQGLLAAHEQRGFFQGVVTSVVPNPAPSFCAPAARIRHEPVRIGFVGRWSKDKGADLIESLWLRPSLRSCEWHLIGPGTASIQPPQGKGYGPCTEAEIFAHFAEWDVLLVPSQIMENQPTVILEAMACGLPVIASKQAGIEETLQGAGTVCEREDTQLWEQALSELQTESDDAYQERVTRIKQAWHRYDPSVVFQSLVEVLTLNRKI